MDCFRIDGPVALSGSVQVAGSKNAALPILAASLLAEQPVELRRVPQLGDVHVMRRVLACLGAELSPWYRSEAVSDKPASAETSPAPENAFALSIPNMGPIEVPPRLARAMRASFCVLGPLLARRGRAVVPLPGGCRIGPRPIEMHLAGLAALGAELVVDGGRVVARAERLRGATIDLTGPRGSTVTGTANVLSAATRARGKTVILGAAREPEIVDLGRFLQSLGARIEGLGSPVIEITGVDSLGGARHTVIADRIEAATLLLAAAITGCGASGESTVRLTDLVPGDLAPVLAALAAIGFDVTCGEDWVAIRSAARPLPADLVTGPHPGLPTDVQAQFTALLALAIGRSTVRDDVFPERFRHVAQLRRFGANMTAAPGVATIDGCRSLRGATVVASDLRASSALVLAALAAQGRSTVRRIEHLDRGYESLDAKLRQLGATIERTRLESPRRLATSPAVRSAG
ncbi:MAG TPA: UDP-N-acetylglucosamine 1-carboxyvinyltransferase [Pirellulales bacterium]|nr:UDP-N-acetylglucosamine 1-carboxyvinyltransferase [Pirellulales bacterium]